MLKGGSEADSMIIVARYKPRRQRTKPVDVRLSRSNMASLDPEMANRLLREQRSAASSPPVPAHSYTASPMLPPLPTNSASSPPVSPAVAIPLASGISPSSSSGSLSRTEGRVRGARGPRPLPGSISEASAPTAPSAPPATSPDQTLEPSAPPAEEVVVEEPESFQEAQE